MLKGVSASVEAMGRILISVFVIGVIVILLAEFLPSIFGDSACRQKQEDSINSLISDMQGTGASTQFKSFTVQNCVTYIDFGSLVDCKVHVGNAGSSTEKHKCYEVLYVGSQDSNCGNLVTDTALCRDHLGTFYPLPGALSTDVNTGKVSDSVFTFSSSGIRKLVPGEYTVMISPYTAQFSISKQS